MKWLSFFLSFTFLIVAMACATVGRNFDLDAARFNLHKGGTKEQVLQTCGEPLSKQSYGDIEMWRYVYIEKNVTGAGVIAKFFGVGTEWRSKRQVMEVYFKDDVIEEIRTDSGEDTKMHY